MKDQEPDVSPPPPEPPPPEPPPQPPQQPAGPAADELASWRHAWQEPGMPADAAADAALAARAERVKRGSRRFGIGLLALTAGELLFSALSIALVGYWVYLEPEPWRWALLVLAVVLVVWAEVFVLRNRRGTYRPRNQTTQAFVELEWLRAERQLRTIRFTLPFFLIEMAALAALRLGELSADPARAARVPALAAELLAITGATLAVMVPAIYVWYRRVRRKMKELEPLRAAFGSLGRYDGGHLGRNPHDEHEKKTPTRPDPS